MKFKNNNNNGGMLVGIFIILIVLIAIYYTFFNSIHYVADYELNIFETENSLRKKFPYLDKKYIGKVRDNAGFMRLAKIEFKVVENVKKINKEKSIKQFIPKFKFSIGNSYFTKFILKSEIEAWKKTEEDKKKPFFLKIKSMAIQFNLQDAGLGSASTFADLGYQHFIFSPDFNSIKLSGSLVGKMKIINETKKINIDGFYLLKLNMVKNNVDANSQEMDYIFFNRKLKFNIPILIKNGNAKIYFLEKTFESKIFDDGESGYIFSPNGTIYINFNFSKKCLSNISTNLKTYKNTNNYNVVVGTGKSAKIYFTKIKKLELEKEKMELLKNNFSDLGSVFELDTESSFTWGFFHKIEQPVITDLDLIGDIYFSILSKNRKYENWILNKYVGKHSVNIFKRRIEYQKNRNEFRKKYILNNTPKIKQKIKPKTFKKKKKKKSKFEDVMDG